jgi:Sortase domain
VVLIVLAALLWFALPFGNDMPEPADPTRAPPQSEGVPEAKAPSGAKAPDESILPVKANQPDAGMCVVIPKIGVDARVIRLGLNEDGSLQVPQEWDLAGGWTGGTRPGQIGPAVIAGHVDSVNGPAVFYDVKNLVRRDNVSVVHPDGGVSKFVVTNKIQVPKVEFPTAMVYGPIDHAGLRLITCGGEFNTATGTTSTTSLSSPSSLPLNRRRGPTRG